MLSNNAAVLTREKDGAIFVTGPRTKTQYQIAAKLPSNVTGYRLDVLADKRLGGNGPGRADNGNFLLNEFRIMLANQNNPFQTRQHKLIRAQADFTQSGFDAHQIFDGVTDQSNNGWAFYGSTGTNHTLVMEAEGKSGGDQLAMFYLDQQFQDGAHSIGKFKLYYTVSNGPIMLDLPGEIKTIMPTSVRLPKNNVINCWPSIGRPIATATTRASAEGSRDTRSVDPALVKCSRRTCGSKTADCD